MNIPGRKARERRGVALPTRGFVVLNGYSKAVLRACVDHMTARFAQVDYFPSCEMVLSAGPAALKADNVHVADAAVERVMQVLLANYVDVAA